MNELAKRGDGALLVIKGLEDASAYQQHKEAVVQDLAPAGIMEMMLVERIALTMWKIKRLDRYEAAYLSESIGNVDSKLDTWWEFERIKLGRMSINYRDVEGMFEFHRETIEGLNLFKSLDQMKDDDALDGKLIVSGMWALAQKAGVETEDETLYEEGHIVPGEDGKIYDYADEEALHSGWTVRRASACLRFIASEGKVSPDKLIYSALDETERHITEYAGANMAIENKRRELEESKATNIRHGLKEARTVREDQKDLVADMWDAYAKLEELRDKRQNSRPTITISHPLLGGVVGEL